MTESCKYCGGTGHILIDDLHVRQCICAYAKDMKVHLGPVIASARSIEASPLYVSGGDDLTKECIVIRGWWEDVRSHLKWVLFHKGLRFRYRLITDEKLVSVYLGKEAYAVRAKSRRDDVETYNGLVDLIGEEFPLVIIRLGCLGHANRAAPGILKEALMLRENIGRPTWLVETPDAVWGEGNPSYSLDVATYVLERFREVAIKGSDRGYTQDHNEVDGQQEGTTNRGPSIFREVAVDEHLPDLSAVVGKRKDWRKKRMSPTNRGGSSGPAGMPI
jgi:hypothetical protein